MNNVTEYEKIPVFKINGHSVMKLSGNYFELSINCPFPYVKADDMTEDHSGFIMGQSQAIVNYMIAEGIVESNIGDVGVMIKTIHPKQ